MIIVNDYMLSVLSHTYGDFRITIVLDVSRRHVVLERINNEKVFRNDDDVEIFRNMERLKRYLTFRGNKKHDEWVQPFINELLAIGIPNHPLFFRTNCTKSVRTEKTDAGLMSKISTMRIQKI